MTKNVNFILEYFVFQHKVERKSSRPCIIIIFIDQYFINLINDLWVEPCSLGHFCILTQKSNTCWHISFLLLCNPMWASLELCDLPNLPTTSLVCCPLFASSLVVFWAHGFKVFFFFFWVVGGLISSEKSGLKLTHFQTKLVISGFLMFLFEKWEIILT